MSAYDSSSTTLTAVRTPTNADLIRTAITQHLGGRMREWVGSADLQRLASHSYDAQGASIDLQAGALHRDLLAQPTAHALVATAQPDLLARSERSLALAAERSSLGDDDGAARAAIEARTTLRSAIAATATRLAVDEREVVTEAAARSLDRMGYELVSAARGDRSQALWAVRGDRSIAILVQDGGAVETDVVGCPGDTCEPVMDAFRAAMAEEGVVLELGARSPHGDSDGGSLVTRARATDADTLAAGLVQQFERPASRRSAPTQTSARARLRTGEAS